MANGFGDMCENLLSDPYVLFLETAAFFFDGSQIPTLFPCRVPPETFIPSLVLIGKVVSEKKNFEKLLTATDSK